MEKEIKTILKKTVKIAGVTCLALGGAALIASGAALKGLTEGAKYAAQSIRKIAQEKPEEEPAEADVVEEAASRPEEEQTAAEEPVQTEQPAAADLMGAE